MIRKSRETPPGENAISICPIPTATSCRLLVRYNDLERITFADEGSMAVTVEMEQTGDPSMQATRWGGTQGTHRAVSGGLFRGRY